MKKIVASLFCLIISYACFAQRKVLLDEGWRFHRGDTANAEQINFKDNSWRNIDLPQDWSIEHLPGTNSPFNPDAVNGGKRWFHYWWNWLVPENFYFTLKPAK